MKKQKRLKNAARIAADAQQLVDLFRQSQPELKDELKERLRFSKVETGKGNEWLDPSAKMRGAVAELLYGTAIPIDLPFLHYLIEQEALYCGAIWGGTGELHFLADTIFYFGDFSSLPVLWRSKSTSFDTHMVIDSPGLFGAGIDETMAYLKNADFLEKNDLLEYLQQELATKPIAEFVARRRDRVKTRFSAKSMSDKSDGSSN
jgi:hypothetical protein